MREGLGELGREVVATIISRGLSLSIVTRLMTYIVV